MANIENNTRFDDGLLSPYIVIYKQGSFEIYKKKTSNKLDKNNGKKTGETYEREVWVDRANSLERCIEKIIILRTNAGNKKVKTLLDFYSNLKKINDETKKVFGTMVKTEEDRIIKLEKELKELKELLQQVVMINKLNYF